VFCSVQQLQTFPETILIRFIELVERTIEIPVLSFHITDMIVNQQKFAGEQTTGPLLSECGIKRLDFWVFPLLVLTLVISTISPLLYWIQIFQESSLYLDKRLKWESVSIHNFIVVKTEARICYSWHFLLCLSMICS